MIAHPAVIRPCKPAGGGRILAGGPNAQIDLTAAAAWWYRDLSVITEVFVMAEENELTPVNLNQAKSATSRIDLSQATVPSSSSTAGIRIGMNPKKATSRIDISSAVGGMPSNEDIYKQRTALLDTSNIPLSAAPAQPRTIRIGSKPTVRVGGAAAPATFSPGRPDEEPAPSASSSGRPTIKLKRPGGASISLSGSDSSSGTSLSPEPMFSIQQDEGPGAAWAVIALFALFGTIGLVVVQVMTMNGSVY